jgi:membrane associated rhomboid family serine protease
MSYDRSPFALTPWVRRLMMATGAVYLLQVTVFTSPWLTEVFGFSPADWLRRPWGFLSYALLHGSFLHFLMNMLVLFMFGPPVEGRLGGRTFLRLYVLSALGGSVLSLLMMPITGDASVIGASAAIFGVMLAFVLEWPDAPVLIFPIPAPVRAKWLVIFYAAASLLLGFLSRNDGIAHFAHLGGFAAAFLYLRGGAWLSRPRQARPAERSPAVLVRPSASTGVQQAAEYAPPPPRRSADASVKAELDRVLDKISERGPSSLTAEERRFLDEMSKRFQQDH